MQLDRVAARQDQLKFDDKKKAEEEKEAADEKDKRDRLNAVFAHTEERYKKAEGTASTDESPRSEKEGQTVIVSHIQGLLPDAVR